jgi:hypothetical protein
MIKWLIIIVMMIANAFCFGGTVLYRKVVLTSGRLDEHRLQSNLFLTQDGNASVLLNDSQKLFLYNQSTLKTINKDKGKNKFIGAFLENNHVMLTFVVYAEDYTDYYRYSSINIYDVQKGFEKPVKSIRIPLKSQDKLPAKMITVPCSPHKYYVFDVQETFWGVGGALSRCLSGGHAIGYLKPYLAKIEQNKMSTYEEVEYDGERYEDFEIDQIVHGTQRIHCLGFRHPKYISQGILPPDSSIVLYYLDYNVEEGTNKQNRSIYEAKYDPGRHRFGTMSLNVVNDTAFAAFAFNKYPYGSWPHNDISQISSDIYFFESDKTAKAAKISEGFLPTVKFDSNGNVHVLGVDSEGQLFIINKKQDNDWSDNIIILKDVRLVSSFMYQEKYFDAEFDKDDNLHIVYPSNDGNITYVKMKLD